MAAPAQGPRFDIAVKEAPTAGMLGDCPFCHRALLTLEEKGLIYQKTLIDFANKPAWLLEVNPEGSVPVMKDLTTGQWIVGSAVIADWLEEHFPLPVLGTTASAPHVGDDVFPAFVQFLKSTPDTAAEKEAGLVKALDTLEAHLAAEGPFVGGEAVSTTDCSLMPKLYHMQVALKHFKDWELPERYSAIRQYIQAFEARPSWQHTYYAPDVVIAGWQKHLSS